MSIIFLDIDGTLTVPGMNVPPASALEAIQRARQKGNKVFLCTGRNYGMLFPLLQYGFDGYISSSGGQIVCGDELIYDSPMDDQEKKLLFDLAKQDGIFATIETKDNSYTDDGFKDYLVSKSLESGNSELLRWRRQIEENLGIKQISEYDGAPIYKMILMADSNMALKSVTEQLGPEFTSCIHKNGDFELVNAEIIKSCFDKGKAIQRVCDYLNVSINDTFAFGDSMNDIEMIQVAGYAVCMKDGSDELKAISDMVCPRVEDDGIYFSFMKLGLI